MICEYIERVDQYFLLKTQLMQEKYGSILSSYCLFRNLLLPEIRSTESVEVLFETLKKRLKPQPILIAERYKFIV